MNKLRLFVVYEKSIVSIIGGISFMIVLFQVLIKNEEEQIFEYKLINENKGNKTIWKNIPDKNMDEEYSLQIEVDECENVITNVIKGNKIAETENDIKMRFLDTLFELHLKKYIEAEDGFDDANEEEIKEIESDIINPYNPKLIRVDTKPFSIAQIKQMLDDGDIDLSPDFQRGFVWTDITRKSRLIESLLLRIPLPVFYLSQDEEGRFQVVDGVQRLTVLKLFMNNEFKLKNLEYLYDCEGKWYKNKKIENQSLTAAYTRRIEQTQLFFNIIDPQTPDKVKFDIFKRINTGGKALNNQEIRNCLANSKTREFLHTLSSSEEFINATKGSVSHTRMADEELILRFIAFYLIDNGKSKFNEYKGGMDVLLDETVNILNKVTVNSLLVIRKKFLIAMKNSFILFGNRAFRKSNYINKALFLGISRVLCEYQEDKINILKNKNIYQKLEQEINTNLRFSSALSMGTNDAKNINLVLNTIKKIMEEQ